MNVVEQGIIARLNSSYDPVTAVLDAFRYMYYVTATNKFFLSNRAELENKLKFWAKQKFASKYVELGTEKLNSELKKAMLELDDALYKLSDSKDLTADFVGNENRNNIVKLIIAGANQNVSGINIQQTEYPLLTFAVDYRDTDLVRLLLAYNFDVNMRDSQNWTALMSLVDNYSETYSKKLIENINTIASLLIAHGANINAKSKDGATPLIKAVLDRQKGIIEFLLSKGADVNEANNKGITALMYAIQYLAGPEIIQLLIDHDADVYMQNVSGQNALKYAEVKKNNDIIDILKKAKAKD